MTKMSVKLIVIFVCCSYAGAQRRFNAYKVTGQDLNPGEAVVWDRIQDNVGFVIGNGNTTFVTPVTGTYFLSLYYRCSQGQVLRLEMLKGSSEVAYGFCRGSTGVIMTYETLTANDNIAVRRRNIGSIQTPILGTYTRFVVFQI